MIQMREAGIRSDRSFSGPYLIGHNTWCHCGGTILSLNHLTRGLPSKEYWWMGRDHFDTVNLTSNETHLRWKFLASQVRQSNELSVDRTEDLFFSPQFKAWCWIAGNFWWGMNLHKYLLNTVSLALEDGATVVLTTRPTLL